MQVLKYTPMDRKHYKFDEKKPIKQHGLEVIPGYFVTVDEMEGGLMLCLDTAHRVLRNQTVYEYLRDLSRANPQGFRQVANQELAGNIVITKYNNKTYKISEIDWNQTPLTRFDAKGGSISFQEYYKNNYDLKINDLKQPMILSKQTKMVNNEKVDYIVCLVPELTYFTGLTDAMRNDFRVMKDVGEFSRLTPNQRLYNLKQYLNNVKASEECKKILATWGLSIADSTVDINARCLGTEEIVFGQNFRQTSAEWSREACRNHVLGPVDIKSWLVLSTKRDANCVQQFTTLIIRSSRVMGCNIARPNLVELNDDRTETYTNALNRNLTQDTQVVVIICPTIRTDRYSSIKKILCVTTPVPSQVILSKNLTNPKKMQTIISKIALQINCKLGGSLWMVKLPSNKGFMIIGIDVYHGGKQGGTVCGFTASINGTFTRWFSEAFFQQTEMGQFYRNAFKKALEIYRHEQGHFPEKVFIFRDGVGDGQLDAVSKFEIPQFKEVLKQMDLATIAFTFVVVQKRINTRIFARNNNEASNPPAGTVVDSLITRRNYYDFYLVPQTVTQGTVNPTHYIVLEHDESVTANMLQLLSYKLCHLYYNWTGTIRVPAPCQYSHKLAAMVGQTLQKIPSQQLCKQLWYL